MLHNTYQFLAPVEFCLLALKESDKDFFLTGSRFFGGATDKSDWDFIARQDESTETFLRGIGFKLNEDVQDYLDPMTAKVLTKHFCFCEEHYRDQDYNGRVEHSEECQKIDIQLCHDFDTKIKVRDILKESFKRNWLPGDKYQRSDLWSMVYNLVKAKE